MDFSQSAIDEAKLKYSHVERTHFVEGDLFDGSIYDIKFDLIYDRAMWVALPPSHQQKYIDFCLSRLKSKGLFATITFNDTYSKEGPPWPVDLAMKTKYISEQATLLLSLIHI